jgi:hypothetical protein
VVKPGWAAQQRAARQAEKNAKGKKASKGKTKAAGR